MATAEPSRSPSATAQPHETSRSQSRSHHSISSSQAAEEEEEEDEYENRLPIRTYHCAFCKQILLATTRDVTQLPRRGGLDGDAGPRDRAFILPLPKRKEEGKGKGKGRIGRRARRRDSDDEEEDEEDDEEVEEEQEEEEYQEIHQENKAKDPSGDEQHYSILLSTTAPAASATIIRRADGFEKRLFLRCGRCRVVFGYILDDVHFPARKPPPSNNSGEEDKGEGGGSAAEVVYLLPGAVVDTDEMMSGNAQHTGGTDMREWEGWEKLVPVSS